MKKEWWQEGGEGSGRKCKRGGERLGSGVGGCLQDKKTGKLEHKIETQLTDKHQCILSLQKREFVRSRKETRCGTELLSVSRLIIFLFG